MNSTNPFLTIDEYVQWLSSDAASLKWAGNILEDLKIILMVSITIYVLYKGYLILAGKTQEPVRDILWDLCGKAFIIGMLYGAGNWVDWVKDVVRDFFDWAVNYGGSAGANGLVDNFGKIFDNAGKINTDVINNIVSSKDNKHEVLTIGGYISAAIGVSIPFVIYLSAKISIFFMITLAPVVIFLRLYGFSKNIFAQWLKTILSTLFTVLMLGAIVGNAAQIVVDFQNHYLSTGPNYANPYEYLTQFSIYSLLMVFLAKICVSISQSLVQVSLENAGMNAATGTFSNVSMASRFGGGKGLESMTTSVMKDGKEWAIKYGNRVAGAAKSAKIFSGS